MSSSRPAGSAPTEELFLPQSPRRASRTPTRLQVGRPAARALWPWPVWLLVALAVLGGAVAIVFASGMTPSFDPYGWLTWGHQLLYGNLNLNAAPSWKPLMIIFTLPMALLGHDAPRALSVAMVAGTLAMAPFAARIAYRLAVGEGSEELPGRRVRIAAWIGALFAAIGVLGLQGHGIPLGSGPPQSLWQLTFIADSDPLCTALMLAAVDAHLSRRPRLCYGLLFAASLGRPEAWAFLAVYGVWMWWRVPGTRLYVLYGWVLVLVAWYLPTAVAAKSIFQASKLDQGKASAIHGNPVLPVLRRWVTFYEWPMQAAALLGTALGLLTRDRRVLLVAVSAALWLAVEIVFALKGLSAVARYMIEPAALMVALGGYGIARLLAGPGEALRAAPRVALGLAGAVLAVGLIAGTVHFWHLRESRIRTRLSQVTNYGVINHHLSAAVARAGGRRAVLACGQPAALNQYQTQLAWTLGLNGSQVLFNPTLLLSTHRRIVLFSERGLNAWTVHAYNVPASLTARCARLDVTVGNPKLEPLPAPS